jgi:1-phosphofructokinase family hexose kinase
VIICVTPNTAVDRTLIVPGFRVGEVFRPIATLVAAGGKGANVARAIQVLGGSARCAGLLGGGSGRLVAELAAREGLDAVWTPIDGETRTCTIIVAPDRGEATVINEAGPLVSDPEWARFEDDVLRAAAGADTVCFCGSLPPGVPATAFARMIAAARASGTPAWIDSSGMALEAALTVAPTGIKINGAEAGALLHHAIDDVRPALAAAAALRQSGIGAVVLTLGRLGAILAHETGRWWAEPPIVPTVSAVGSGDAFLGGLVLALTDGMPLAEALRHGVAAGAANARSAGGGAFAQADFAAALAATIVRSV